MACFSSSPYILIKQTYKEAIMAHSIKPILTLTALALALTACSSNSDDVMPSTSTPLVNNNATQTQNDQTSAEAQDKLKAEQDARAKAEQAKAEAEKAKADAEAKLKAEQEARARAEQAKAEADKAKTNAETKLKAEQDAKAKAEKAKTDAEKAKADAEAKAKAEAEAKLKAEQALATAQTNLNNEKNAKAKAEQAKAEADKARLSAEKAKADADAKLKSETEARLSAEKAKTEADKAKADAEAKLKAEQDARAKAEQAKAEADKAKADAETKLKAEQDARAKAEKAKADAEAKLKAEQEARAKAEAEAKDRVGQTAKTLPPLSYRINHTSNTELFQPLLDKSPLKTIVSADNSGKKFEVFNVQKAPLIINGHDRDLTAGYRIYSNNLSDSAIAMIDMTGELTKGPYYFGEYKQALYVYGGRPTNAKELDTLKGQATYQGTAFVRNYTSEYNYYNHDDAIITLTADFDKKSIAGLIDTGRVYNYQLKDASLQKRNDEIVFNGNVHRIGIKSGEISDKSLGNYDGKLMGAGAKELAGKFELNNGAGGVFNAIRQE